MADVVVVGAGIIGCAIARELASRGLATTIVDPRPPGGGATQASAGMAGRGVDILLGGNPEGLARAELLAEGTTPEEDPEKYEKLVDRFDAECRTEGDHVRSLGGLYVLGTERHESRRIDNQLRGRSGRQGDPGESRFYLSLEDELMKLVGASNWFVRVPFMAEGLVQGLIGAFLAVGVVVALKAGFDRWFDSPTGFFRQFYVTSGDAMSCPSGASRRACRGGPQSADPVQCARGCSRYPVTTWLGPGLFPPASPHCSPV